MKRTKMIAASTLALAITIGGGIWANPFANAAAATQQQTQNGGGPGMHFGKRGGHGGAFAASEDVAKLLGMTTDDLKAELQSGKTLADIAAEKGVAVQSLIDLQVTAMTTMLDQQLADSKITQAQYDERKAKFTDKVTKIINGNTGMKIDINAAFAGEDVAKLLGMTTEDLKTELQSGKTLAAIAGEKNVTVQSLVDLQVATMADMLYMKLADGTLTQEQSNQRKADFMDKVTKMDNGDMGLKGGAFGASEDVAKLLGMTVDELKTELQSGKTLAAIAGEKSVAVQSVIDLQVTAMTAKLDQQLADGKITQTQYDSRKAKITDRVTKMVNGEMMGMKGGARGAMMIGDDIAKLLGMTTDELKTELQSGKTLAAIAGEKNVAVQSVIDLQVKAMTAKLDQQLADGKITQTQYDSRKAKITDMVTKMVNGEMGMKGGNDPAPAAGTTSAPEIPA